MAAPLAVWMFVVLLLFSAVIPLGPPETLMHGAAFNPATNSVAITAKRGDQGVMLVQGLRGARLDGAPDIGTLLPLMPAFAAGFALFVFLYARSETPVLGGMRHGAHRARAPPLPWSRALQRLRA